LSGNLRNKSNLLIFLGIHSINLPLAILISRYIHTRTFQYIRFTINQEPRHAFNYSKVVFFVLFLLPSYPFTAYTSRYDWVRFGCLFPESGLSGLHWHPVYNRHCYLSMMFYFLWVFLTISIRLRNRSFGLNQQSPDSFFYSLFLLSSI
jgi:hypothetical protein